MSEEVPSAIVLRNKGVPINLYVLDEEGMPIEDKAKGFKKEKVYIRFASSVCAGIEEAYARRSFMVDIDVPDEFGNYTGRKTQTERVFEGLDAWEQSLQRLPFQTMQHTLAIALDTELDELAKRLIPEDQAKYSAAIGAAWMMAQGLDPESAGKLLAASLKAAKEKMDEMAVELAKLEADLDEDASSGTSGSKRGSAVSKQADSDAT